MRWVAGQVSGRSPVFEPRIPGKALRVYPYRLAVHPGSSGHLAKRSGRVLASTGRPVSRARIWLVEHALRGCQYLTSTQTRGDGSFEVAYPVDALLDAQRPDLRFIVFGGPRRPLLASSSSELVLAVETVNARSLFDDVGEALKRYLGEVPQDLAPEDRISNRGASTCDFGIPAGSAPHCVDWSATGTCICPSQRTAER